MEKGKNKTITDKIWEIFASVKLAVILFSCIALTSIIGTILEQQDEQARNVILLTKLLGESIAPTMYDILFRLGFMDMYRSWWFISLLLLFASNLIICSIDRVPRILKIVKEPIHPLAVEYLEKMSIKRALTLKGRGSNIKELTASALRSIGFRPSESSNDNGVQMYTEKGNFTRLGVYVTHASILIILAGAIIGLFFGFNAYLPLNEGETSSVAYKGRKTQVPLGFEIRCDSFVVDFYDKSDRPKGYKSWLTIIKNNKEVMKKSIEVNDPLTYEGITFYQSSYGTASDRIRDGIFILKTFSKNGENAEINPKIGDSFTIPGTSVEGHITDFSPAISVDPSGKIFTYAEQMLNPAVYIEFSEPGRQKYSGWILKRYPQTWNLPGGNRVEFLDYWGVEYTGLQVRKDPGVFLVYLGCIIMSIGLYITFFMSHKRIWVNIAYDKNNTKILISASVSKNRPAFERKIEKLAGILNASAKGRK